MMRFSALASVIATVLIGLLQAPVQAQETIRIGVLEPMTGPANKNGIENYTAMEIARDMINERGGINGRRSSTCWQTFQIPPLLSARPNG